MVNAALESIAFHRLQKHAPLVHTAIAALHAATAHGLRYLADATHHIGKIMNCGAFTHGLHMNIDLP